MKLNVYLRKILALSLALPFLIAACEQQDKAQKIVDKSIARHGGDLYEHVLISFDFRKRHYQIRHEGGKFTYESWHTDSTGVKIHDVLNNQGFTRYRNGSKTNLSAEDSINYFSSLNSVVYFALLPYGLNESAVIKEYLGISKINGNPYHKIHISFKKEGGGKDYEDEFIYWFHKDQFSMDYLAYRYHVEGGGTRFRDAYNMRKIKGITFADYHNYKYKTEDFNIANYDSLFEAGDLEKVSEIKLRNIEVKILPEP